MLDEIEGQLTHISATFNALRVTLGAKVSYDAASDALVWSDELPPPGQFRVRELWCIRPLLRYRTSLILAQQEDQHRAAWESARRLFPSWAGFEPSRNNRELADIYTQLSQKTNGGIDKLFS